MKVEIIGPDFDGYAIKVEGDVIMECLSESDVRGLRVGELIDCWEENTHA